MPIYQSRSKILRISKYLQFLKISIRSNSQSGDLHWPLRKPCSYITLQLAWGLSSFIHSYVRTSIHSRMWILWQALLWTWGRTFDNKRSPTWGTQIPPHLNYFSWRPCWNFSLYPSIDSHFINPLNPQIFFHKKLSFQEVSDRTFLKEGTCKISTLYPSLLISEYMLSLMILIVIVAIVLFLSDC